MTRADDRPTRRHLIGGIAASGVAFAALPPVRAVATGAPLGDGASFATVTDAQFAGGADPTGVADSSPAFRAALASGRPVFVPRGVFRYRGEGLDHEAPVIVGAGQGVSSITLDPDVYFVDSAQRWLRFLLTGIRFDGGAGHVRNRFTGGNVTDLHVVSDCAFIGYSRCAISHDSTDHPYWKIERNVFHAGDDRSSMGVALSADGSTVVDNAFRANRVHVKLANGGNNVYVQRNDFLRMREPEAGPRIDVWVVPAATSTNCGSGFVVRDCKFGNEFLDSHDRRIVYADEGAGEHFGDRFPLLDRDSAGWIGGHTVTNVHNSGIGDDRLVPLVYSTTANIVGGVYGPVTQSGNRGAPIIAGRAPLARPESNVVGPLVGIDVDEASPPSLVVVQPWE